MPWVNALLIESPPKDHGIIASYQARIVLAKLLFHERSAFSGNLNYTASDVGLKPLFFRKGVEGLIALDWLTEESNNSASLGPPSKSFRISPHFQSITTPKSNVGSWQLQIVETLLFPEGRGLKTGGGALSSLTKIDLVLAVLILSSNQSGFVCNLSMPEVADRSGVAENGLKRYLNELQAKKKLLQFPGVTGNKIYGSGPRAKSVYQLNLRALLAESSFSVSPRLPKNDDIISNSFLYPRLFKRWNCLIGRAIPQDKAAIALMSKMENSLSKDDSGVLSSNLILRLLSGASYLMSCKDYRSVFAGIKNSEFDLNAGDEVKMIRSLLQNESIGLQLGLGGNNYTYEELIESSKDLGVQSAECDVLALFSLCLCILSIRLVVLFCLTDEQFRKDVSCEQNFIYAIHWWAESHDLASYMIKSK